MAINGNDKIGDFFLTTHNHKFQETKSSTTGHQISLIQHTQYFCISYRGMFKIPFFIPTANNPHCSPHLINKLYFSHGPLFHSLSPSITSLCSLSFVPFSKKRLSLLLQKKQTHPINNVSSTIIITYVYFKTRSFQICFRKQPIL